MLKTSLQVLQCGLLHFNHSNVSLRITPPFSLSEGHALSTFADEIEENLFESGMNYTIVYRDWRAMDRAQAYEIVYSYKQDGTSQQIKQVAVRRSAWYI